MRYTFLILIVFNLRCGISLLSLLTSSIGVVDVYVAYGSSFLLLVLRLRFWSCMELFGVWFIFGSHMLFRPASISAMPSIWFLRLSSSLLGLLSTCFFFGV